MREIIGREHSDLVAQGGDLGLLGGAGLKCRGKQSEKGNEDGTHCENDDDLTNNLTSVFSTRTEFSATTGRAPYGSRHRRDLSAEVPGYNLHIMLVGLGCVIGLTAVIAIARALRARSTLNENRMMRDYLRRIASERNPDF